MCPKSMLGVETIPISQIPIRDTFFDSLREDYQGFDAWYSRAAGDGREAWKVATGSGVLDNICIFKIESAGEIIEDGGSTLPGRFLKMCTLKVTNTGSRYGERLIYCAFSYALTNGLSNVYVQVRKNKHERLRDLLNELGFVCQGSYRDDDTYVKDMTAGVIPKVQIDPTANFRYHKLHSPYYLDASSIRKFRVTLDPVLYEQLFPDISIAQSLSLPWHARSVYGLANAIRKLFLQNSILYKIRPADILFFYHPSASPGQRGGIECVGIVEEVKRYSRYEEIELKHLEKSPYSESELRRMIEKGPGVAVVVFRLTQYINPPISYNQLTEAGVETNHRRVKTISDDVYRKHLKPLLSYGVVNEEN